MGVGGTGTIIINKDKLKALQKILPTIGSKQEEESKEGPTRVVVPPGTGSLARKTVTGGIKNRLGKTGSVKSRLGHKDDVKSQGSGDENVESVVIIEEVEDTAEEEMLRKFAIKSLDLRSRINTKDEKRLNDSLSDSETEILKKKIKKLKKKRERVKD